MVAPLKKPTIELPENTMHRDHRPNLYFLLIALGGCAASLTSAAAGAAIGLAQFVGFDVLLEGAPFVLTMGVKFGALALPVSCAMLHLYAARVERKARLLWLTLAVGEAVALIMSGVVLTGDGQVGPFTWRAAIFGAYVVPAYCFWPCLYALHLRTRAAWICCFVALHVSVGLTAWGHSYFIFSSAV